MERLVHEFIRHGTEEMVKAHVSTFAGALRIDLRVYFRTDDGAWHPTKRGLAMRAEDVENLQAAADALEAAVCEEREKQR
jgi:hypothetical protein